MRFIDRTEEESYNTYETLMKIVEYKNLIPQRLYDAMYRYEVGIND